MKALIQNDSPAGFRVVADSAIGRDGQPWFVPDFGSEWTWTPMAAFRIGRLGKCISPKFASRYIDGISLMFVPECNAPEASVLLGCMDGAIVPGQWLTPFDRIEPEGHTAVTPEELGVNDFIAKVSRHTTLKTGDIIALKLPDAAVYQAIRNTKVSLTLNNRPVLAFNIK